MDTNSLSLTPQSIDYLSTAKKWALFLAVVGFIMVALLIIMGIFMGFIFDFGQLSEDYTSMASVFSVLSSIVYFVMALIYFIPVWFLFKFSQRMGQALELNDKEILTKSFRNLKNCFLSYGILTILAIIFYGIFFVISFFTALGSVGAMSV